MSCAMQLISRGQGAIEMKRKEFTLVVGNEYAVEQFVPIDEVAVDPDGKPIGKRTVIRPVGIRMKFLGFEPNCGRLVFERNNCDVFWVGDNLSIRKISKLNAIGFLPTDANGKDKRG